MRVNMNVGRHEKNAIYFQTRCQGQRVEYVPRKIVKEDDLKRGRNSQSAKSVKFSSKASTKV